MCDSKSPSWISMQQEELCKEDWEVITEVDVDKCDMVNFKLKTTSEEDESGANLRTEFEGSTELPYTPGNMETSPKRKAAQQLKTAQQLTAGDTKTSLMRQEMNSGKGGKSKWSWKEREDDMRELERKNLEQKREIQKLKKQSDTTKTELDAIKEKLAAEQNKEIATILSSGEYLDPQGAKYIIVHDDIAREADAQREEEVRKLKSQIEKLEYENNTFRDTFLNTEEDKNTLVDKLDGIISEKQEVEQRIQELLKEKEELEMQRGADAEQAKYEFETVLEEVERKLEEKEKEGHDIENEKKDLLNELDEIMEAKKLLEFEIAQMNGVMQEQVEKIDELSTKIFGRDDDLRSQLEEVERAREECKILQESNNVVESEQELFISEVLSKLDEITKTLQSVEYAKKPLNCADSTEDLVAAYQQSEHRTADFSASNGSGNHDNNNNNNEDALNEELNFSNLSSDSIEPSSISPRSTNEVVSKFEEVKNVLLQKICDIDHLISSKDIQINNSVLQTAEWKANCEKIDKEAKDMKTTFEGLLEIKEKENQDMSEANEKIQSQCQEKIAALDQLQQNRLAGIENSDAYYRGQVQTMTNNFERKTKDHETALLEHAETIENLRQESNFLKSEIELKERELSEMSRKYELSISQVEEREKGFREENETYLSEEIDRIQNESKNKVKKLEDEREINEARLTQEYEEKITELMELKNRELLEMSRKYELSISQVEEREKGFREENETYLSEEIERIQNENENKLKKLEAERETNEARLTQEYEEKIIELEVAYDKLKSIESEDVILPDDYAHQLDTVTTHCDDYARQLDTVTTHCDDYARQLDTVSTHCDQLINDRQTMEELLGAQKAQYEEELRVVRDTLALKIREFELLQAKYDAQHRLVDFVTLSLEQERAKKNNSNDEILNILEKLEAKVSETYICPNESNELYASESSINSLASESLPGSVFVINPLALNTTWPPKHINNDHNNLANHGNNHTQRRSTSPIRRWSSLGVLEQDQEKRKELIDRLRSEISMQLNGMAIFPSSNGVSGFSPNNSNGHTFLTPTQNLLNSYKTSYKLPKPWSNMIEDHEDGSHLDRSNGHLSPLDRSNGHTHKTTSLAGSTRAQQRKNKISYDSGLDQNEDINELISYPHQLHNVIEMFKKLEEQHEQMKEDSPGGLDKQWSVDLDNWKQRIQYKLNDIQEPSERCDSALSTISNSSILFHPDDNEVKAIIENANKMYDNAHFVL